MSLRASATSASSSAPQRGEFLQQTLQAWQPIITPRTLYVVFLSLAIPFIAIGAAIIDASSKVVEHSWQYDGAGNTNPNCAVGMTGLSSQEAKVCTLEWTADRDLAAPIFVYYGLDNFYQNHRRYVKSKSDTQLAGTIYSSSGDTGISDCSPAISNNGKVLHPCGLIANSFFNDTFNLLLPAGVAMSEKDISWESDRSSKFKAVNSEANYRTYTKSVQFLNDTYPGLYNATGVTLDVNNEHFIVWMRPAALPQFRKLYGRIDSKIAAGTTIRFQVASAYPVSPFSGKKFLVISTMSWMGGKNDFLGIAYVVVGCLCVLIAGAFFCRQKLGLERRLGDAGLLVWAARRS